MSTIVIPPRRKKWGEGRQSWRTLETPEAPKAHEEIPDGLGLGVEEKRDGDGQLWIKIAHSSPAWIVLGKFAAEKRDGTQFYVALRPTGPLCHNVKQSNHIHLIMAIAKITELIEEYGNANVQD